MTVDSQLPHGWSAARFGDVCKVLGGFAFKSKDYQSQGVPLIRISSISDGGVTLDERTAYLPAGYYKKFENFKLNQGDILMALSGATTGKVGIFDSDQPALLNQRVGRFAPNEIVDRGYLRMMVRGIQDEVLNTAHGGAQPNISPSKIEQMPILLPPLNEQRRIVAKIEDLTPRSQAAKQALDAIPPLLERFRQSVLAAAFRGDLTKQWRQQNPNVEPATELLKRIHQERRHRWEQDYLNQQKAKGKTPKDNKWKEKYQEPEPFDTTGLPELPEGWCWAHMGDAFEVSVGATPSRERPDYWDGSIPWVSSGEVAFCRISSTRERITEAGLQNSSTNRQPPGTLLIGMIGEGKTRGQVAILDIEACNNQNAAAIRVSMTPVPTDYVYYYLEGQYQATRLLGSGNNQQALNKSRVQAMILPIAPLEEQHAICAELETLLSRADAIRDFTKNSLDRMSTLNQSILAKAFRGELVPRDSNDEPASALLERIRTEREPIGPSVGVGRQKARPR